VFSRNLGLCLEWVFEVLETVKIWLDNLVADLKFFGAVFLKLLLKESRCDHNFFTKLAAGVLLN